MRWTLLILVILVVLAGATLAWRELRRHPLPLPASSLHGVAGIAAIVLAIVLDTRFPHNRELLSATVLLILTATGGLLLFGFRAAHQSLPAPVVVLHAAFALAALGLVIAGVVLA
ncbi:MAG: hypothetical protein KGQ73_10795 [Gammaproteobacteria bacterium]|nr:hypothetical protein [Gammaproteobacteria bacterium]